MTERRTGMTGSSRVGELVNDLRAWDHCRRDEVVKRTNMRDAFEKSARAIARDLDALAAAREAAEALAPLVKHRDELGEIVRVYQARGWGQAPETVTVTFSALFRLLDALDGKREGM